MDTDNLSNEAYDGIIIESEKFNHDLALQFGVLASDCKDEEEFLNKVADLISELRTLDKDELIEVFFGNLPDIIHLNSILDRLLENIDQVRKIPKVERHYEF